jgi:prepilin peptidase CpaA
MVNAAQMTSETLAYATLGGLAIALLISIYTDIRYRLILNKVTIAIALGAPIFWLASGGFNLTDIGLHLLTAAITFFVFVFAIAFHLGAIGIGAARAFGRIPK